MQIVPCLKKPFSLSPFLHSEPVPSAHSAFAGNFISAAEHSSSVQSSVPGDHRSPSSHVKRVPPLVEYPAGQTAEHSLPLSVH
jgi:hypothetical protein